jgi:hypothetical protein
VHLREIAVTTSEATGDRLGQAAALNDLGRAQYMTDDYAEETDNLT